jgi:hypothetical protein
VEGAKRDVAQQKAKGDLSTACKTYKLKHGEYPAQLADLLQGRDGYPAYLESEEALIDPWNQQYRYDPAGPRNNGNQPDIWTVNPDTGEELGNWPKGH